MNSVPDGVIQHILSLLSNARDIASCACVSKRWRDSVPFIPSLYFPRNAFDSSSSTAAAAADAAIGPMVAAAVRLQELVVYCPFSAPALASWLSLRRRSLRSLELRMDSASPDKSPAPATLDCIGVAEGLEELKLWGVSLTSSPSWEELGEEELGEEELLWGEGDRRGQSHMGWVGTGFPGNPCPHSGSSKMLEPGNQG